MYQESYRYERHDQPNQKFRNAESVRGFLIDEIERRGGKLLDVKPSSCQFRQIKPIPAKQRQSDCKAKDDDVDNVGA